MYNIRDIKPLEGRTEFILREVKARFKKPCLLWSGGKDSTVLIHQTKKTFFGEIPFDVILIDTGKLFPETYKFIEKYTKEWNIPLKIAKMKTKYEPGKHTDDEIFNCCMHRKTLALKQLFTKEHYDSAMLGIRWDELGVRGKERIFSPRTTRWEWRVSREKSESEMKEGDAPVVALQEPELWNLYQTDFGKECEHIRVHPILHWNEIEIWEYIKQNKIPYNPLYNNINGYRYRSIGCKTCTSPIKSEAYTLEEIQTEIYNSFKPEREGRVQKDLVQERLRALGYM